MCSPQGEILDAVGQQKKYPFHTVLHGFGDVQFHSEFLLSDGLFGCALSPNWALFPMGVLRSSFCGKEERQAAGSDQQSILTCQWLALSFPLEELFFNMERTL